MKAVTDESKIDPDPFLIAAVCLQGAAVILQLVQIAQSAHNAQTSSGAIGNRKSVLTKLEKAIEDFDAAIATTEKAARRASDAPDKEIYESSFRISLGVMNFTAKSVQEYHKNVSAMSNKLSAMTIWIGMLISQDPDMAAELGNEVSNVVSNSSQRLNELMANGGSIEAVLREAKLVRDALKNVITKKLDDRSN